VAPLSNRQVVDRYVQALVARDLDLQAEVCAPDMVVEYPQSGERIRGWANIRAVHESYPGGLPQDVHSKVIGSEDRWVVGPSFNLLRVEGRVTSTRSSAPPGIPTARPGR
jgi:ketosteroid isomerase-like protein